AAITSASAARIHRDRTFTGTVSGAVYAQPLFVEQGVGGRDAFVVATEENHVTALDSTGRVLWDKTYGAPAARNMPCGNISPLGITGTPVIDATSRTVYFDTMTTTDADATHHHKIHAVSLEDGAERSGWPVDVDTAVPGFKSNYQSQRGALQLLNGVLYVPY